jgi:hypothetical protein
MKKLLMFLVLLTVSVGTWAAASATQIANNTGNGKGFYYDQTTYAITAENAGDLAAALSNSTTISNLNMTNGTYFTFTGPLNADDLKALSQFGASNGVYFDFSNATFVDEDNNELKDTSILKDNLTNTKVNYLVLPNTTTSIKESDFPSNILEAEAINPTTKEFFGYSSSNSVGTLENILNFDLRACDSNLGIEDFTLVGNYTYNPNSAFKTTYSTSSCKESVFGFLAGDFNRQGFGRAAIKNLDLSGARFPNYGITTTYSIEVDGRTINFDSDTNAMELITEFNSTLESVDLPTDAGTTLIPFHTFYNCKNITSFDIPGNFQRIGFCAFEHCENATTITFHEGLTDMDPDAFLCCYALTEVDLPVGLHYVGEYAFNSCTSLESIVIPEGVTELKAGCFEYTNIVSIRLPNSLEYIDDNAFRQCLSLKTVTIPANVKKIGSKAFLRCSELTDVYVLGTTTIPECAPDAFDGGKYRNSGACEVKGNTSENHSYGYEGYADIIDLTTADHAPTTYDRNRKEVDETSWNYGGTGGAAILHYPQVSREAAYASAATTQEISDYIAAQSVDDSQILYYIENGNYKRVFFTPNAEDTYYHIPDEAWSGPFTSSQTGVSAYYNSDGYYVTPFIKCGDNGNAPQYYEQNGMKPTWSSVVKTPQKDGNDEWITTYYKYEWNGSAWTYNESPLIFSQPKYHSPVTSTVDNYVGTSQPVPGVTDYYASDGATNTVTPQLNSSLYYVSGSQTGGYVNTNREFKGGSTAYYILNTSTSQYERVYPGFNGYTVYSDNAGNTQVYQMSSDVTTYYYKDYSDNTIKEIPNGLQVFDYNNTYYYYDENAVIPVYSLTSEYNSGTTYYYKNYDGSYIEQTSLQFNTTYYYKDGTKTVTTYTEATVWDPTITTYYNKSQNNGQDVYTPISSWTENDFQGDYYYQTGTEPNYVSVCGTEYKPSHVYYTDNTGTTVASPVNFDGEYYTLDETQITTVSSTIINQIILKQTKTYAYKDANDEYHIVDAAFVQDNPNTTYYEVLQTASDDAYGEYYTVPERNARYGGVFIGEDNHGLTNWPDDNDLYAYPGGMSWSEGVHFDLINGKDYSGWKNFLLAGGYSVEEPTIVVPIEHVKKDVWYTICLPFDMTDDQLSATFGAKYELAEFAGVSIDDAEETYTLNFTRAVNAIVKHHPYMIHPYTKAENADGTPAEVLFTVTGVNLTADELNAAPSEMIKVVQDGFTFVGYGHNYDNDSEVEGASPVVIPQWAFYLAQDPAKTYPMFYRQTGANDRTTGGRWTKNTAVVLPPSYKWGASDGYTDTRTIYNTSGEVLYGGTTPYYNYLCEEYVLEKPAAGGSGGSVKSMFINFTNEPINHDADAIDIIVSKTEAEQTIPAEYKDKIFNLSGQMVGNNADGLEKGIYIKNGKKFIVR